MLQGIFPSSFAFRFPQNQVWEVVQRALHLGGSFGKNNSAPLPSRHLSLRVQQYSALSEEKQNLRNLVEQLQKQENLGRLRPRFFQPSALSLDRLAPDHRLHQEAAPRLPRGANVWSPVFSVTRGHSRK